jgi:hypothetical protein
MVTYLGPVLLSDIDAVLDPVVLLQVAEGLSEIKLRLDNHALLSVRPERYYDVYIAD